MDTRALKSKPDQSGVVSSIVPLSRGHFPYSPIARYESSLKRVDPRLYSGGECRYSRLEMDTEDVSKVDVWNGQVLGRVEYMRRYVILSRDLITPLQYPHVTFKHLRDCSPLE